MEASSLSVLYFKPQLRKTSFFSHVMIDKREGNSLRSSKQRNLVLAGNFVAEANPLPAYNGQTSVHTTLKKCIPFKPKSRSLTSCRVTREESGGTPSGENILQNEQTLEKELQIAINEENYTQAAKLRDTLRLLQDDTKASVLAANAKFYNSFRNGDLAAMQSLWSKGEHVCVVHPGVSGISGYDLVMGSWEFVWADYEFPLEIEIKDVQVQVRGDMGYVTCIEMVKTKGGSWGRHFSSNVFEKVEGQWFICIHHASYVDL